jgi:hypothetical protein
MKRRVLLVFVVIWFSANAFPQFQYYVPKDSIKRPVEVHNRHFAGEKKISVSPNFMVIPGYGIKPAGGIKFQVFLGKRISLDADLVIGKDYMHGGPGVIALPFWLLFFNGSGFEFEEGDALAGFLIMVAAGILSFEHVSYHIPLKNDFEISPYVSLLRFKQFIPSDNLSFDGGQFSFANGVQIDKYFGRFFISPYLEYNIGYSDHKAGINGGVGFGISFPRGY